MSRLDGGVFLPRKKDSGMKRIQILSLLCFVKTRVLKEDLGISPSEGLQGAHFPPAPLGGEGYSAYASHHMGGLPGEWLVWEHAYVATFSKQLVHKQRQMNTVLTGCINISLQLTVFCPHREVADFLYWGEDFRGKVMEAAQAFLDACIRKQAVCLSNLRGG